MGYDGGKRVDPRAWAFLRPYVEEAVAHVFSRESFAPSWIERTRLRAIPPSIDPFAPKNQALEGHDVQALLTTAGLITGNRPKSDIRVETPSGSSWADGPPAPRAFRSSFKSPVGTG